MGWRDDPVVTQPAAPPPVQAPPAGGNERWRSDPAVPKMSVAEDVARSAATGAGEGVTQSVGMLGDIQEWADRQGQAIGDWFGLPRLSPEQEAGFKRDNAPTTADIEAATGFDQHKHTPQTTAGEYSRTAASFAAPVMTGGLAGGVRTAIKAGGKAATVGAGSEAAGQYFEGSAMEPVARIFGALATGGVMGLIKRPSNAAAALKKALPDGVTDADIAAADALVQQSIKQGVPVTWPEALSQTTNGRVDVTNLQRLIEQTPGGRQVMSDFMAQRPGQVTVAGQREMDRLSAGARMIDPVRAGLGIQQHSKEALTNLRKRLNDVTRPLYRQSATTEIDIGDYRNLTLDPIYTDALAAVKKDPIYSRMVSGLPPRSIAMQDAIKKYLDDLSSAAEREGKNYAASSYGGVARDTRDTAARNSPEYRQALEQQAKMRQRWMAPAEAGPLGKMAATDDLASQVRAVFDEVPLEGSDRIVRQAIRRLTRQDSELAFQLVRTHIKKVLDESTQAAQGGGNAWGGAKFVAEIAGNSQQAKNLEAAVRALPNGNARWQGLKAFMDTLEATGKRQKPGSLTAFNQKAIEDLSRGGVAGEAARTTRSLGARLFDFYEEYQLGKNSEALAQIITDPRAGTLLRRLANAKSPIERQRLAGLLVYYSGQALNGTDNPVPANVSQ